MGNYVIQNGELYHYGILGMKWGKRKANYNSTGLRAAIARKKNQKIDAGFDEWKKNDALKKNAIDLGKKATQAKLAYEKNPTDDNLKTEYKTANKEYKKALGKNTAYRKGVIKSEVGKELSRKYLSEAKKVKKELDKDPLNKDLKKQYNELMSKHDVERAKARRAESVGQKRSSAKAGVKRAMTMTAKAAAGTAICAAGAYAVNKYLTKHKVTLNGRPVSIGSSTLSGVGDLVRKGKNLMGYMY